jgi:cytochrome c-type biogenesis protein CcmH/NrfG
MSQKSSAQKLFQRIVIIASSLALVGSSVFFLIEALISTSSESDPQPLDSNTSIEQLKAQATGYEKVLAREPNNAAALQNLAKIRLQLQDYQGAIVPLEKLVQLYPNEPQLKQLLTAVQQQTIRLISSLHLHNLQYYLILSFDHENILILASSKFHISG